MTWQYSASPERARKPSTDASATRRSGACEPAERPGTVSLRLTPVQRPSPGATVFVRGVCQNAGRSQHAHVSAGVDNALGEFVARTWRRSGAARDRIAGAAWRDFKVQGAVPLVRSRHLNAASAATVLLCEAARQRETEHRADASVFPSVRSPGASAAGRSCPGVSAGHDRESRWLRPGVADARGRAARRGGPAASRRNPKELRSGR